MPLAPVCPGHPRVPQEGIGALGRGSSLCASSSRPPLTGLARYGAGTACTPARSWLPLHVRHRLGGRENPLGPGNRFRRAGRAHRGSHRVPEQSCRGRPRALNTLVPAATGTAAGTTIALVISVRACSGAMRGSPVPWRCFRPNRFSPLTSSAGACAGGCSPRRVRLWSGAGRPGSRTACCNPCRSGGT